MFFNKGRREAVSKTLLNIVQIGVAAVVAGDVFIKLSLGIKIILLIGISLLFVLGITICPPRRDE
jgi:ABC-type uncharacterized transport system permease subunit